MVAPVSPALCNTTTRAAEAGGLRVQGQLLKNQHPNEEMGT
jgi:hypothetical protein